MGVFDFLSRKERRARAAERAELAGDLVRAVELFVEAGRREDAARLILARAEAELEPKGRLILLARAVDLAPPDGAASRTARRRRALLTLELARAGLLAAAFKNDLREAAEQLLSLDEGALAAEAFELAGDAEGRARALVATGAVDEVEAMLGHEAETAKRDLDRGDRLARVRTLTESGERREALLLLDALLAERRDDATQSARDGLVGRRLADASLRITRAGEAPRRIVVAEKVRVGRTDGEIKVAHAAVSRHHFTVERRGGEIVLVDAGSRNGLTLRGARVERELVVKGALDLRIGGEVPLGLDLTETGARLDIGGELYELSLGPYPLAIGDWRLERDADGWVALKRGATPAFLGELAIDDSIELLAGDGVSTTRGGAPAVRVER